MKPRFHCDPVSGDIRYTCARCGAVLPIVFPLTIKQWLDQVASFAAQHEHRAKIAVDR